MATDTYAQLPLFPLQAVLFPGGLLRLKVFEARYLDLIGNCLREQSGFGVVALRQGAEVQGRGRESVAFEHVGVLAELGEVDSPQPNILQVQCHGTRRFRVESTQQRSNGMWVAQARLLEDDPLLAPSEPLHAAVRGLANAIAKLRQQGSEPFLSPFHFDDAGWVANRWCEILPISQTAKQKLMELDEPLTRLQLVDDFLRSKGVVA